MEAVRVVSQKGETRDSINVIHRVLEELLEGGFYLLSGHNPVPFMYKPGTEWIK